MTMSRRGLPKRVERGEEGEEDSERGVDLQVRCGAGAAQMGEGRSSRGVRGEVCGNVRSAGMSRGSVKTGGELGLRLGELWAVECGPRDYGSGQQWMSPNESDAGSWP
ncbi:hypothetical protein FOIG_06611 [Fusarium odoratissimum NRRL 54006]|uniref:Uncharacterized protein n=1 Tax=Fusarium odoratissimum (strain NRRL 54006) TaxID=1089451 RepID=X0K164_FUSO5|nr:uncharacterized protein FOIG_06611 [Fusarium odoratissimum NRRL 54006]EXM02366.1 hypothetical protein FOIG_06611 [Fusarium odoratissimum NRRL 54006]